MRVRSFGYDAEGGRIRLGLQETNGARSYRELDGDEFARARVYVDSRIAWLAAREPGISLRSLRIQLDTRRALITLEGDPPRALTLEDASFEEFVGDLEVVIG